MFDGSQGLAALTGNEWDFRVKAKSCEHSKLRRKYQAVDGILGVDNALEKVGSGTSHFHHFKLREDRKMKLASITLFAVFAAIAWMPKAVSQTLQKPEDLAMASAQSWLTLIDSEKYAESWQEASTVFKANLTQEQWVGTVKSVRSQFGKVLSRKVKSAKYTRSLPGAPDGEYVVLQFDTSFANKKAAVETLTPALDKDGKWRVSGYFIK